MLRVLLAGGGTAGHVNPALAIAEIIKEHYPDAEFCFAGNPEKLEAKLVPEAGYRFEPIKVEGFQRKLNFKNVKRNIKAVWYLSRTGSRSKQIINDFKPNIVIGTGGYVSGPVVRKAAQLGIKTAIHEANAFAGVTTKLLSKNVDKIMLTVEDTKNLDPSVKDKAEVTGLPVRKAFERISKSDARHKLGFADNEIVILSAGGSLGSRVLNENVARLLKWYQESGVKVNHIHSFGTYKGYSNYISELEADGIKVKNNRRLIIKEYIDMPLCMAAADLVITRCGASTLTELESVGRGAILIPSPSVAENHQYYNGMVLQKAGAGYVFEEKDLTDNTITAKVKELIEEPSKLERLSENAARLFIPDTADRIYRTLRPLIESAEN
ncbi:undecaprenyldiphospho-muramoylpentapeptide beta-N-acetylglucosaminyltransferase [Hominimerdicola sp. 21CYCFAH17_S]